MLGDKVAYKVVAEPWGMLFILISKRKDHSALRVRLRRKLMTMLIEALLPRLVLTMAPGCTLIEMTCLPSTAQREFSSLLKRTLASLDSPYLESDAE